VNKDLYITAENTLQHFQRGGGKCPLLPMPVGAHTTDHSADDQGM